MTRLRLLVICGFLTAINALGAEPAISIDESKIRLNFAGAPQLEMPVANLSSAAIATQLALQFLDTKDTTLQTVSIGVTIHPGSNVLNVPLPKFFELEDSRSANYGWLRLSYSFADSVSGIVSVSRIAPEPFVLRVLKSRAAVPGAPYGIQVVTQDPIRSTPVADVAISSSLTFGDPAKAIRITGRTNAAGYAVLHFDVPKVPPDSDGELEVTAQLGNFVRNCEDSISLSDRLQIITNTDKPIYQPGQTLGIRVLVFDSLKRALEGIPLDLTISDSHGNEVFETRATTSSYGEAHADWEIPSTAQLGNYAIEITPPDPYGESRQYVRVDRYDLPNFTVSVKHDHPYYLPNQNAQLEIHADYLFGQPVRKAAVKVVRETERHWDYRESKWVVTEGSTIEGTTDEKGHLITTLNLKPDHIQLSENERHDYEDLNYAAYVTDPTTNRTEQRRFDIRITKYAIHLYVAGREDQAMALPLEFYISASYADGAAAVCDIDIFEPGGSQPLGSVRANKYGVARVMGIAPPASWAGNRYGAQLELRAKDAARQTGRSDAYFHVQERFLRVHTNKTLYRSSDPISVDIESTQASGPVILNVLQDGKLVYSTMLELANGKAKAVVPKSRSFKGDMLIAAVHAENLITTPTYGLRRVSFPKSYSLEIEARPDKPTYSPGDEARVVLRVRSADGSSQESLIGLRVIDKAVEERARTDEEFGQGSYSFCPMCSEFRGWNGDLPGLTQNDLERLDRKRPIADDLSLAAEVLLFSRDWQVDPPEFADDTSLWSALFSGRYRITTPLAGKGLPTVHDLPKDEAALRRLVLGVVPDFESRRDPWGNPYHLTSSVSWTTNQINVISAGPDEQYGDKDDLNMGSVAWPYFQQYGALIQNTIQEHHLRTGGYIRDVETLKRELALSGHAFDQWRDPWGYPYRAETGVLETRYTVTVRAGGPGGDKNIQVWNDGISYTTELWPKIDNALGRFYREKNVFPDTEDQLSDALSLGGVTTEDVTDPWGRRYYASFKTEKAYTDRITFHAGPVDLRNTVPVTQETQVIRLRSAGPDGIEGTPDDFNVMSFIRPITEQAAEEATPRIVESPLLLGSNGAIEGIVVDATGARIPGVAVRIERSDGASTELVTDGSGVFLVRDLQPGSYRVQLSLAGFRSKVVNGLVVRIGTLTHLLATLEIATLSQSVEVSASANTLLTTSSASIAAKVGGAASKTSPALSTPRLREYFPETLLWQPSLQTSPDGSAEVRFKLADSVTTWKVAAMASTKDGRIGLVEKEILSTQPFFLEHDPPKVLTQGDEIALPVVVRSFLEKNQSLELSMKPERWFTSPDTLSRRTEIEAGEARREIFRFKALLPVDAGKQRITAIGTEASDAIEKTSTVHPDGREISQTSNRLFQGASRQDIVVPPDALPGSVRSQLKIYPNLMTHIVDSIEGIMQRPYGCAEQTISSAYPSLLLLRYNKGAGNKPDAIAQRAARYVEMAYRRLMGYQADDGGFSYWTHGDPDTAVTAYALQFLHEAKGFVAQDEGIPERAYDWLVRHQSLDGSWRSDASLTGYIARVLSTPGIRQQKKDTVPRALEFLSKEAEGSANPYSVASFALAAVNAGELQTASKALDRLESMAYFEEDAAYWDLRSNTPFYGWGLPGRVETTAMAVRALAAGRSAAHPLVDQGLIFLLKNKDRFGVWHSTQATVRVLEVLADLIGGRLSDKEGSAEIFVNGSRVASVAFGGKQRPTNPAAIDLSKYFVTGANRVEVRENKRSATATIQLVESHYVTWGAEPDPVTALRFSVRFDKTEPGVSEEVTAHVVAERVGFRGYGMLLAEIGLPPGAEVDRASLETAIKTNGWNLYQYDVLPDRIVAYLWPPAGGTSFDFKFRPRYGVNALSPASTLYDYYNPEERVVVEPTRFVVGACCGS